MFVGRTVLFTLSSRCPVFLLAEVAARGEPVARKLVPLPTVFLTQAHANQQKNEGENTLETLQMYDFTVWRHRTVSFTILSSSLHLFGLGPITHTPTRFLLTVKQQHHPIILPTDLLRFDRGLPWGGRRPVMLPH